MPEGTLRLKSKEFADQLAPVDAECACCCCKTVTRAYLHVLFKEGNPVACQLLTAHNIAYMMRLMRAMRAAIEAGERPYRDFVREFLRTQFPRGDYPRWVVEALQSVDIDLTDAITN